MNERKVNLFLVGAMKAGTTSFVEVLSKHPEIYISPVKEPHFFVESLPKSLYEPSKFFDLEKYLNTKFPEPLHIANVENENQYQKIYSLAKTEKYLLDASTAYLHAPNTAHSIYEYNPNAKIIILLRDPLKRAFSHYKMDVGLGRINKPFEKVINSDIIKYSNEELEWYSHLGMSFYNAKIKEFKDLFENVLVVSFKDIMINEEEQLKEISSFLEISTFEKSEVKHKNIARKPKYQSLFFFLKKLGLKDYFSKYASNNFKQWVLSKTTKKGDFEMELSEATKNKLITIFEKESY